MCDIGCTYEQHLKENICVRKFEGWERGKNKNVVLTTKENRSFEDNFLLRQRGLLFACRYSLGRK